MGGPGTERLLELAAEEATGALHLNGPWGATVYLRRGRIDYVESALTPGIEALLLRPTYPDEQRWAALVPSLRMGPSQAAATSAAQVLRSGSISEVNAEIVRRTALADAALATLGIPVPETTRARARFRPGERHWYDATRTFDVREVLTEVERRRTVLSTMTLGVKPDRPVHRVSRLPSERIRLTSTWWDIIRLADGSTTPLDIAWMLGHGVFATTTAVHQLARLGVLTTGRDESGPEASPGELVPARHVLSFVRAATATATATGGIR